MRLSSADARSRLESADHGVLATLDADRSVDLVPVCFAVAGDLLAIPIDRVKDKGPGRLGRERNLELDPRATLLCEHWNAADWSRLWWVRATLLLSDADAADRTRLEAALRAKYRQYAGDDPFERLLVFRLESVVGWSA